MGIIRQHIRLNNPSRPEVEEIDALALVDSGAIELCLSPLIAKQLKLDVYQQRDMTLADGSTKKVDYAGPVTVEVFGRKALTGALVLGDGVLLGAVPMQTMDVLIDPRREQLVPNPENPSIPGALVMSHKVELP